MRSLLRSATILLALPALLRAQSLVPEPLHPVDWNATQAEALQWFQQYLRIDTTNPPGNELAGARFLKAILDREGIEAQILDTTGLGAGRANLYARFRGNGSKKAVALVHHMDVVPVDPRHWSVPPFSGL